MRKILLLLAFLLPVSSNIYSQAHPGIDTAKFTAYGIYLAMDLKSKAIFDKAQSLSAGSSNDYIEQVCQIFDFMYYNWKYVNDPGGMEYFMPAVTAIESMTGDCDDYAIAMVSLLSSLGGDGRVVCVSGHAYPEMYLGKDLSENSLAELHTAINKHYEKLTGRTNRVRNMHYHHDYDGTYWLNLDWQSSYPGGRWVDDSPDAKFLVVYTNGSYREAFLNNE